jgi:hypothetical protein
MLFWAYHRNTPRKLTPSSFSPTTIITRYHPSLQAVNSQTPQLQLRLPLQLSHALLQLALDELLLLLPRGEAQRAMQMLQVPQQRQSSGVGRGTCREKGRENWVCWI